MNNITRDDIAEFINNEFGLTKKDCNNLVNDIIEEIIEVTTKPIIVDGDTGGRIEHFRYRVKTLERLGVSAIIIVYLHTIRIGCISTIELV